MAAKKTSGLRPVLVTTEFRGVFFGYAKAKTDEKRRIHLERARNCVYWSAEVKGFIGLASTGPSANCKIGPAADLDLFEVTCEVDVTPEAVKAWEASPWK